MRYLRCDVDHIAARAAVWFALLISGCVHGPSPTSIFAFGARPPVWRFAVAGDSRNCGDVVMPAIAEQALQHRVAFYWHLGDFRWMSNVDEDMQHEYGDTLSLDAYRRIGWGDFITHQMLPFGSVPVYLGMGNHELYESADHAKSHADFLEQFAYWLDTPAIRAQRLRDGRGDEVDAYYHWKQHGVDFINLDNSGNAGFEPAQLKWLEQVLTADGRDPEVHTLVVGMHRALPNSLACGHSMNDGAASLASGRQAYDALLAWKRTTGRRVYVLAGHSHYFMERVFETPYWKNRDGVLPGWIIGTAGARRYPVPENLPPGIEAKQYVYGYLLATVSADGEVELRFEELGERDVPESVVARYGRAFVDTCFRENADRGEPKPPPASCAEE